MEWLRQVWGAGFNLADGAFAAGGVLAMALVCLLQYVVHLSRLERARRRTEAVLRQMQGLEGELGDVQRERTLARLENQILREFVAQTETDQAIDLLLRRYVENARTGFAALVRLTDGTTSVERSRGLTDSSHANLRIDAAWIERLLAGEAVTIDGTALAACELAGHLSREDRAKVTRLHLLAAGDDSQNVGIFVTTALYPTGAPLDQQTELARRLLSGILGNLRRSQALAEQQSQLRSVHEILELRSIADGRYAEPREMIDAFLTALQQKLAADRATLYLTSSDGSAANRAVARCGRELAPLVLGRWQRHEDRLAELNLGRKHIRTLGPEGLQRIHIDTLIRSAVVVPLPRPSNPRPIGIVCFTWQHDQTPSESQLGLLRWAADYLAENLLRVVNHVKIERQARQDGLTELANRRTFDEQIEREVEQAARTGSPCALLLLDLDRFKAVNDTYGHQAGDETLRTTARILREQALRIRARDRILIARYGGEELAMLLPGINAAGARRIGESIRAAVAAQPIRSGPHEIRVTLSVGLAVFPEHARGVADLIAAADAALYHAKEAGRNRVCCASDSLADIR